MHCIGIGSKSGGIGTGEPVKGSRQGRDGTHRPSRNGSAEASRDWSGVVPGNAPEPVLAASCRFLLRLAVAAVAVVVAVAGRSSRRCAGAAAPLALPPTAHKEIIRREKLNFGRRVFIFVLPIRNKSPFSGKIIPNYFQN